MEIHEHNEGCKWFTMVSEVAFLALILPHSNATEERVFSLVNKNKTKLQPSLQLDGTPPSILTTKPAAGDLACHKFKLPSVLDSAKKQGRNYTLQKEEAKENVCNASASTDGSNRRM